MTMTPDELRALADALEQMAKAPRFADFDVPGFCAWVRACADAQPVAWMHPDGRVVPAATMDQAYRDGGAMQSSLRAYTIPLYAHHAPAAPQAMEDANVWKQIVPDDEPQAEPKLGELMREQRNSRIVAGAYPDGNPNAGAIMAQTSQAEPKREPLTDAILAACKGTKERAAKACEALAFPEGNSHWSDGFNTAIKRCAAAIRALGRQHD